MAKVVMVWAVPGGETWEMRLGRKVGPEKEKPFILILELGP